MLLRALVEQDYISLMCRVVLLPMKTDPSHRHRIRNPTGKSLVITRDTLDVCTNRIQLRLGLLGSNHRTIPQPLSQYEIHNMAGDGIFQQKVSELE